MVERDSRTSYTIVENFTAQLRVWQIALDLTNKSFVVVFENSDLLFKTQEILYALSISFTAQHVALKFLTKQKWNIT